MGMFDSLYIDCPHCKAKIEIQSKAGDCMLASYNLENAPQWLIKEAIGSKYQCDECGGMIYLGYELQYKPLAIPVDSAELFDKWQAMKNTTYHARKLLLQHMDTVDVNKCHLAMEEAINLLKFIE